MLRIITQTGIAAIGISLLSFTAAKIFDYFMYGRKRESIEEAKDEIINEIKRYSIGNGKAGERSELGLIGKEWLIAADDERLKRVRAVIVSATKWTSGSIVNGDFDDEIKAVNAIDGELSLRERCVRHKESE